MKYLPKPKQYKIHANKLFRTSTNTERAYHLDMKKRTMKINLMFYCLKKLLMQQEIYIGKIYIPNIMCLILYLHKPNTNLMFYCWETNCRR